MVICTRTSCAEAVANLLQTGGLYRQWDLGTQIPYRYRQPEMGVHDKVLRMLSTNTNQHTIIFRLVPRTHPVQDMAVVVCKTKGTRMVPGSHPMSAKMDHDIQRKCGKYIVHQSKGTTACVPRSRPKIAATFAWHFNVSTKLWQRGSTITQTLGN